MKKYILLLLLFPIFAFWDMPRAHAIYYYFELLEDGQKFTGEKQMAKELTSDGTCRRDERCELRYGYSETLRLYKVDNSAIYVTSVEYEEDKKSRKKQNEKRAEYFLTVTIPPPPADMLEYNTVPISACFLFPDSGLYNGYARRIKIDIKTGEVQDLTPYYELRRNKTKNQILWLGCWIARVAFVSPFLIFVIAPLCAVLFRPIYRVFFPRKGKKDKDQRGK